MIFVLISDSLNCFDYILWVRICYISLTIFPLKIGQNDLLFVVKSCLLKNWLKNRWQKNTIMDVDNDL